MERLFVVPASPELVVPMPERGGARLPLDGAQVPRSSYWTRRIADGSVLVRDPRDEREPAPGLAARPRRPRGEETSSTREV